MGILFVSQYAKQFNYLECKTINLIENKAKCDCEKQLQNSSTSNDEFPSAKNSSNNYNDEYCIVLNVFNAYPLSLFKPRIPYPLDIICRRSEKTIEHPPQI